MKFDRKKILNFILARYTPTGSSGLLPIQVSGVNQLLDFIESDSRWIKFPLVQFKWIISYYFATIAHECRTLMPVNGKKVYVSTFQPITEMGGVDYLNRRYDTRTDLGNTPARDGDGALYGGKGYVQNTGKANASKTGVRLRGMVITVMDLPVNQDVHKAFFRASGGEKQLTINSETFVKEPLLLLVPKISYLDSIDGMLTGRYTGLPITKYITPTTADLVDSRRVINGLDKANEIAEQAKAFHDAFNNSVVPDVKPLVSNPTPAPVINTSAPITDQATDSSTDDGNATEVTSTSTELTDTGKSTTEITKKNEQDVNTPVVVEKKRYGLFGKLKVDIGAILGGNISIATIKETLTDFAGIPLSPDFWRYIIYLGIGVSIIWLIFRAIDCLRFYYVQHKELKLVATNNANPNTRDIYLVNTGVK